MRDQLGYPPVFRLKQLISSHSNMCTMPRHATDTGGRDVADMNNSAEQQNEQLQSTFANCLKRCLNSGTFLSIVISATITCAHFTISILSKELSPMQVCVQSEVPIFILFVLANAIGKKPFWPPKGERVCSLIFASGTCIATISIICSLFYIAPYDSEAIISSNVIFTAILSAIFLGEFVDFVDILALLITLSGVLLISQPSFIFQRPGNRRSTADQMLGTFFGAISALSIAAMFVSNRKIKKTHSGTLIFIAYAMLSLISIIVMFALGSAHIPQTMRQVFLPVIVTVTDTITQLCVIRIGKLEAATYISIKLLLNLPMILVMQIIFLGLYPNTLSTVGSVLIVISVLIVSLKDNVLAYLSLERNGICFRRMGNRQVNDRDTYHELSDE